MADNTHYYGFRPVASRYASGNLPIIERTVISGQDHQDDGSASVVIRPGDPVKQVSNGGINIALTDEDVWGIVAWIGPYWDGTKMVRGGHLPNQNTWGTVEARRPTIGVYPADCAIWEIDCDTAEAAYDTIAEYTDMIGENVQHTVPGTTLNGTLVADPFIDISAQATTNTFGWRIEGISKNFSNQDFTGNYVKMLVTVNAYQGANAPANANIIAGV